MPLNPNLVMTMTPTARSRRPAARAPVRRAWIGVCALALLAAAPASAQVGGDHTWGGRPAPAQESETDLEVRLVTIAPGEAIASRFGHTALWIHDPGGAEGKAYGFGLSDFRRPGFLYQLVEGRMESWGGAVEPERMIELYRGQNRRISYQVLNFSGEQTLRLLDILERVTHPDHMFFNYDFVRANCTTAVRDIIDEAIGGQLRAATVAVPTRHTFRSLARAYTIDDLRMHTLVSLLVVHSVDRPIDAWEAMFVPVSLRDQLRGVFVENDTGGRGPLVSNEHVLYESDQPPVRVAARPPWPIYLAIGAALGSLLAGLGWGAGSRERPAFAAAFSVLAGGWVLTVGLLGVFLAALWAFTGQPLADWNQNLLQANPLLLLLAIWTWGSRRNPGAAIRLGWVIVLMAAVGLVIQVAPTAGLPNTPILPLVLPAHIGLVWGLRRSHLGRELGQSDIAAPNRPNDGVAGYSRASRLVPATETTP